MSTIHENLLEIRYINQPGIGPEVTVAAEANTLSHLCCNRSQSIAAPGISDVEEFVCWVFMSPLEYYPIVISADSTLCPNIQGIQVFLSFHTLWLGGQAA